MKNEYEEIPCELIGNKEYKFHELIINGRNLFQEFIGKIKPGSRDEKSFQGVIALMDVISPRIMLPKTKFRHITRCERKDIFEFKKDNIRVYVIKQEPNLYIILAGYKNNQDLDIDNIKELTKGFKQNK